MLGLFEGSLVLGLGGFIGMAGLQMGNHGHDASAGPHAGDLHIGDHGAHLGDIGAHVPHLGDVGHGGHGGHAGDAGGHFLAHGHGGHHGDAAHHGDQGRGFTWLIPSPIMVFSWLTGFGLAGMLFRQWVPVHVYVIMVAVVNALVFERFLVRPYWQWIFRFASTPGRSLEGTVASRATAVTGFDAHGRGLVRVLMDGQQRDVLARLLPGHPTSTVRKGDALFVEQANPDSTLLVSVPGALIPGPKNGDA